MQKKDLENLGPREICEALGISCSYTYSKATKYHLMYIGSWRAGWFDNNPLSISDARKRLFGHLIKLNILKDEG